MLGSPLRKRQKALYIARCPFAERRRSASSADAAGRRKAEGLPCQYHAAVAAAGSAAARVVEHPLCRTLRLGRSVIIPFVGDG